MFMFTIISNVHLKQAASCVMFPTHQERFLTISYYTHVLLNALSNGIPGTDLQNMIGYNF